MREKQRIFKCIYCAFTSFSYIGPKIHRKSRKFKCDYCDSKLRNEYRLKDHMRVHDRRQKT